MEGKQVADVAQYSSLSDRRRCLASILGFDETTGSGSTDSIALDLLLHLFQFCTQAGLEPSQTSAVLKIVKATHERSVLERLTPERSFAYFKSLLLGYSVQRPPFSAGILSLEHVKLLTEHIIRTYFKHYKLYQYAFTQRCTLTVACTSLLDDGLEEAPLLQPLAEALSQVEWDRKLESARKEAEDRENQQRAEKQAADERARQEEIEAAYRAAIPDEVTEKVRLALEQQLPELKLQLEKKMQEREQALLAKLAALQVH
eukprot:TRINITY_DN12934_c0_g1_i1.p1 TRINITY_DN12934_c0_g1~~TRINITY_DN12934_c0_g1_i1.p1  ORF type:complete len:259 (+),score=53.45 TRINITY_DN12934_c0_g1_i1:105-881(+)